MKLEQFIKLIPNESKALIFGGFNANRKVFFAKAALAINIIGFCQSVNGNAKKCRFRTGIRSGSVMQDSNSK